MGTVIAAITVPNIIQGSQNKEFHSALKKNISVIENALNLAQVEEGMMGDNTSIFTPSDSNDRSYQSVKRLSKYLNTLKICKNKNDTGCSDLYYPVRYAQSGHDGVFQSNNPRLVLNDGSIYNIYQYDTCEAAVESCQRDEYGNCKKDETEKILRIHGTK